MTASPWGFGYANGNSKAEALGLAVTFGVAAMLEYGSPAERAEARMKAADAARDAKALGALAKDAGIARPKIQTCASCGNIGTVPYTGLCADCCDDNDAARTKAADAGIEAGPSNDAALGLPLVMTGPDSTRTLDNLTTWGVTLFGPCDSNCYEYRSASGLYRWSSMVHEWFKQEDLSCGYGCLKETKTNPPTIPPPDWNPHDGTTPGTSKVPAVIADEQRMADVFAECAKAVAALRSGIEMLDEVAKGMKDQPRFRTSLLMEATADSLETAISRANGGAA